METIQPDQSAQPIQSSPVGQKPYTMEPNIEAALSYLLAPITGVVVYVMEKQNKFVRFHAMQSILFGVAAIVLMGVANMLIPVLIGLLLTPLVGLAVFGLWLFLMWKAFKNEEFELPVLGKIARDQINKSA